MIKIVTALSVAAVMLCSSLARAADGTITISGSVLIPSCTISVNGKGANPTITLPTIQNYALANGGHAGSTPITIAFSNCGPSTLVGVHFESDFVDQATGNFKNLGTAGNVQVQLLNSAGQVINAFTNANNTDDTVLVANAGQLNYTARYVSPDSANGVGSGSVQAKIMYSLTYP